MVFVLPYSIDVVSMLSSQKKNGIITNRKSEVYSIFVLQYYMYDALFLFINQFPRNMITVAPVWYVGESATPMCSKNVGIACLGPVY